MTTPVVSVVLPARNAASFLAEAIASVRAQTFQNWELLVVDDRSTDDTAAIPAQFADSRIRVLPSAWPHGVSSAMNTGLRATSGRYVARLDADDVMLPHRLERQVEHLDRHPRVVLCGSWLEIFGAEAGTWRYPEPDGRIKALLLFQCSIGHPSVMLRRSVLRERGLEYDTDIKVSEDYDLWMRLSPWGEFYCIQEVLTRYRRHPRQVTEVRGYQKQGLILRRRWLRHLFGEIDARTLELHERLATLAYPREPAFVDVASAWFERLLSLNGERRAFDPDALRQVLGDKLYDVCATVAPLGLRVYDRMRRSDLGRSLSWQRRAKVLAKAFLGSLTSRAGRLR